MKRLSVILLLLIALFLVACSEKDDNPTDTNIYGYQLNQFVPAAEVRMLVTGANTDTLDYRELFAYEIVSADADAWSPRLSQFAGYDLEWNILKAGFFVPSDNRKTWFPASLNLPNAFKVKNTGTLKLYRKVDIVTNRSSKMAELKSLTPYTLNNWLGTDESAIKVADLLQGIATYDTVRFVAIDGYAKEYTAAQAMDAYYFLGSETTTFPTYNDTMTNSQKKFKKLMRIEVLNASEQTHTFELTSHDNASLSFTVPTSMEGYDSTILTDY